MSEIQSYSKNSLRTSYVTTVIGISIVLLTLGIVTLLLLSARKLQNIAKEQIQVDIFFKEDVAETEIFQLEKLLQKEAFVHSIEFISSQKALESMQDAIANDGIELLDGESPIPPSLSVHPSNVYANADSLKALKQKLESTYSSIDDFSFNERIVEQSNEGIKNLVFIIGIIGILLFLVALALINNTIRLSLYSKRFLIKTMQMVGATSGFIRKPFIGQAFLQGVISALIASGLLTGIVFGFSKIIPDLTLIINIETLTITLSLIFVVGLLATVISTWFALNKYFRLKLDDLY